MTQSDSQWSSLLRWISRLIVRSPGRVVLFGILLTLPCVYWSSLLYSHLKLDLEELLPRKAQSIQDLNEVRSRLKTTESLAILVLSNHPNSSRRFVNDLAARLQSLPPEIVESVEYRIHREIRFFDRRKALFIDLKDLRALKKYIEERLDYEAELYNPLNIFSEIDIPEPRFRLDRFLLKYEQQEQATRYSHLPDGYYATPDEKKRAVLVYLPANQTHVEGRLRLKMEVEKVVADLHPHRYAKDIEIHYTGEVQNNIDEYDSVLGDIERSAFFVTVAVTLALLYYFRSIRSVMLLSASLLMARFWAFALIWFSIGYLNANSAFMGSIVLGSGITFGVMLLSRYLEERRNGKEPNDSAMIAITHTGHATWTAALAAGLAYGSLALTEFEGFRQYGFIGFAAMLLCWISAFTLLPALLLVMERIRPLVTRDAQVSRHLLFGPFVHAITARPKTALVISIGLTGLSLYSLATVNRDQIIETDLSRLRSRQSMNAGSGYWSEYQNEIFQSYLSPLIVLSPSELEARRIASELKKKIKKAGSQSLMVSARSIHDFIPSHQVQKIRLLLQIKELLPKRVLSRLQPRERMIAASLLTPEALRPFHQLDLPPLIRDKFTEKDGEVGRLVLVEPTLNSSKWTFNQLDRFVEGVRETARKVGGTRLPVVGNLSVTRDMFKAINQDGPKATTGAFIAVTFLVIALFRRIFPAGMALSSLMLGVLWMAGAAMGLGLKINFLNFIVLPIAFGIGVDYGVNILERYQNDSTHNIDRTLRETGSAVTLCSITTVIGYVSLIIANNQAFVSFGLLAVAAELGTMLAAIMTLPSILLLIEARRTPGRRI